MEGWVLVMENLFIFPNAVNRRDETETIRLDIDGKQLHFFHNNEELLIDTNVLRDGSSTVILSNAVTNTTYVLYNFREILQVMDMVPSEFLSNLGQRCFMQIDKSGEELFVKVFLLEGMNELPSQTNDFSCYSHYLPDYIHELDWQYSWTLIDIKAEVVGKYIDLTFNIAISGFWKEPIYISHAGQSVLCKKGVNKVRFLYNFTENAYLGSRNCRYKGRAIVLAKLIARYR